MANQDFVSIPASVDNKLVHLDRPRMDRLLSDALNSDLISVVAGAGYGKTEAVYSYLRRQDFFITWIQLSEYDNTPARFWDTFTKAISSINPIMAKNMADIGFPYDGALFGRYADAMTDALVVGRRYVLVFDDFHMISNPAILKFIGWGIDWHFPHMSRLFISREDPFRFITTHLQENTFTNLNEDDLRFTKAEMEEFFELQGTKLSPETAETIYADTDGWIFAINLVNMFYKKTNGRANHAVSAMKTNLSQLMDSEIFAEMKEDQKHFLIKMSLIDHLSPDLLSKLPDGVRLLDDLNRSNSFIRYDAYLDAYRIHNILLDNLKEKQALLSEEEKRDTYEKAANWCIEKGYIIDAVSYFKQLGDYNRIVEIAFDMPLLIPPGIASYLADALREAPQEDFDRNGTLNAVYGRLLLELGRLEEAAKFMNDTIKRTEKLPESDYKNRVLFGLHNNLGYIGLITAPQSEQYNFARFFEKADEYFKKSNYVVKGAVSSINLSPYVIRVGDPNPGAPEQFIDELTMLIPFASHSMNGCMYGLDDLARCELTFFRGDFENSERFGYQALYKAREREQHEIENRALFLLLRINLAGGKYNEIKSLIAQVEAQPERSDYPKKYIMKDLVTSWVYAQIGYADRMANWLKGDSDETEVNYLRRGLEFFTHNKIHFAQKNYPRLLAALESQDTNSGIGVFLFGKTGLALYKAVCHYHLKDKTAAQRWFEEAYRLAVSNSLDMPFIELGNEMRTLASFALKTGSEIPTGWLEMIRSKSTTYAKRIAYVHARFGEDEKIGAAVDLTNREIEILEDLAQGLSRIEIATARDISINTVKTMLPHIFRKLGANNTIDAIRIAIANGIIK
jgi:LuxR family maltose regulon positive regulatory protein